MGQVFVLLTCVQSSCPCGPQGEGQGKGQKNRLTQRQSTAGHSFIDFIITAGVLMQHRAWIQAGHVDQWNYSLFHLLGECLEWVGPTWVQASV